jgi:hypothetical protein
VFCNALVRRELKNPRVRWVCCCYKLRSVTANTALIGKFLERHGASLSSLVAAHLVSKGCTDANARKLIQRAREPIHKLARIRFPHNDRFLYLAEDYRSKDFWDRLLLAFQQKESAYWAAIQSVIARDGVVPKSQFGTVSGSPIRMKNHLSSASVLERLVEIGLFEFVSLPDFGQCISFSPDTISQPPPNVNAMRARVLAEGLLLIALKEWSRNLGLGSYHRVALRSHETQPSFGQFSWDLSVPSYLHPLSTFDRKLVRVQPGFFVADVLLSPEVPKPHLQYFLRKCALMRAQKNTVRFMAMFVAERFTREAFNAGRKAGVIVATTENLFGREISSGLSEMIQVLKSAAAAISATPDQIQKLFSKLDAIKGAENNVRGALFELFLARCLNKENWYVRTMNELIRDPKSGALAEIDIKASRGVELRILECRAYSKNWITADDVEKWLNERVPRIRNFLRNNREDQNQKLSFEFWTTSHFTPEAEDFLRKSTQRTTKYSVKWKDQHTLRAYVSELQDSYLKDILERYYS